MPRQKLLELIEGAADAEPIPPVPGTPPQKTTRRTIYRQPIAVFTNTQVSTILRTKIGLCQLLLQSSAAGIAFGKNFLAQRSTPSHQQQLADSR